MTIHYKNYQLNAVSERLSDTKKWRPCISIINPKGANGVLHAQRFYTKDIFSTQEEADICAYKFGKEIINGTHPDAKLTF